MEFIIKDVMLFRASVEGLKDFLPIASLLISSEGIRIRGLDASHVGLVDYFLSAADCIKADVKNRFKIDVSMKVLSMILAPISAGDSVSLIYKNDKFIIECINVKMSKKAVYNVPTLDVDMDSSEIPDVEYAATVQLKTVDLYTVVKEVSQFGDFIKMRLDEDGLHMSTFGDFGEVKQTLENTDSRDMALEGEFVQVKYSSKYVNMMIKSGSLLSVNTKMEFDPNIPLRLSFNFGNSSHFITYLAPKVDDDNIDL